MLIVIATLSLPFIVKKPIDLPPIISVELIQIGDLTNIPFAPKAKKIIEKVKKEKEKLVSEQAPPKKVKKEKPDAVPLPDQKSEKIKKIEEKKQNPEKVDLIITCLPSPQICAEVMEGEDGILNGLSQNKIWLEIGRASCRERV